MTQADCFIQFSEKQPNLSSIWLMSVWEKRMCAPVGPSGPFSRQTYRQDGLWALEEGSGHGIELRGDDGREVRDIGDWYVMQGLRKSVWVGGPFGEGLVLAMSCIGRQM